MPGEVVQIMDEEGNIIGVAKVKLRAQDIAAHMKDKKRSRRACRRHRDVLIFNYDRHTKYFKDGASIAEQH